MNTATLYRDLTMQGVTLYLDGGALRYRALKGKMTPDVFANIKQHKLELISFLATHDGTTQNFLQRYRHLITCQQCAHLTATGYCRVKPQVKSMPDAMHDCESFDALKTERISIANMHYTQSELNALLGDCEKKLFHHLVDCVACSFMDRRYCVDAFAIGSSYDALLLVFDDAASKREALLNTVIRARISGRSVFVGLLRE